MGKVRNLSDEERIAVYHELLAKSTKGVLEYGTLGSIADKFGVHSRTVSRIWSRAKASGSYIGATKAVKSLCKENSGRRRIDAAAVNASLKATPLRQRTTVRDAAAAIGIGATTLWNFLKRKEIRRTSNTLKPILTSANKFRRVQWVLSHINPETKRFSDMYSDVHVDEKWFYLSDSCTTFYLAKDEPEPERVGKRKTHMLKVMFLCAVARPRFNEAGVCTFDGKLGIWPFIRKEPAKRSSRNRPAGTMETKNLNVSKEVYKQFLFEKVYPAIRRKWPNKKDHVRVIQDNAPVHVKPGSEEVNVEGRKHRRNIELVNQPSNSPDFNILDLGFFRAIQSLQYKAAPRTIDELIAAVTAAFDALIPGKLNDTFLSLQKCMEASLFKNGGNQYKQPHLAKSRRRRTGENIKSVACSIVAFNLAKNIVNES